MTVSTTTNRISYVGNAVTTVFAYNFLVYDLAHLEVSLDGVVQGSGFTVDLLPFHDSGVSPRPVETPLREAYTDEDLSIKRRGRALEERLIRLALERTSGNRTQAARILEISPRALQYKIKEYGVEPLNPLSRPTDTD